MLVQSIFELRQPHYAHESLLVSQFLPCGARSTHKIGELTGVLLESLDCALYSSLRCPIACGEIQLGSFRGDICDFTVLDFNGSTLSASNRMAVHVYDGHKYKVKHFASIYKLKY